MKKKKAVSRKSLRSGSVETKPYAPFKAAKKKAVKKKPNKVGPAISSKRFGNTPVVEDEQRSDPPSSKSSQETSSTKTIMRTTKTLIQNPKTTTKVSSSDHSLGSLKLKKAPSNLQHVVVEARAGTGKTFTLIVGVAWAYGQAIWDKIQREMARRINEKREKDGEHPISVEKFRVKPSAEQQEVWDALAEGRGQTKTVTYCAFNKSIVEEFGEKWGWMAKMLQEVGVTLQFCTINSLGHKSCSAHYGRFKVSNFNPETVLGRVLSCDIWELKKTKPGAVFVEAVTSLVDVCKLTLVGWDQENGFDAEMIMDESLDDLVSHFDIEMPADKSKVYEAVKQVLKACHDATDESFSSSQIDYNDQNWLPVVNNLPVSQVDLLMVDECFPAGTLVETSEGPITIEQIADDPSKNWQVLSTVDKGKTLRYGNVTAAYVTPRNGPLVRIKHEKGEIVCTANHPLFTREKGWVPAGMVQSGLSLCNLQQTNEVRSENVLQDLCWEVEKQAIRADLKSPRLEEGRLSLQTLRKTNEMGSSFVLSEVCGSLEEKSRQSRNGETSQTENIQKNESCQNGDSESCGTTRSESQNISHSQRKGDYVLSERREWQRSNETATIVVPRTCLTPSEMAMEPRVCRLKWKKIRESSKESTNLLQDRHCLTEKTNSSRGGWGLSPWKETLRSKEGFCTEGSRVVSVEVYEPGNRQEPPTNSQKDHQHVYTLSVDSGCYFANGILAKNCQDLPRAKQEFARLVGRRIVCVGDVNQAIYGFAGADVESIPRMKTLLKVGESLKLTSTYRCAKSIVREANQIVPDFYAHEDNPEGLVTRAKMDQYAGIAVDGDMVLCRVNAPLVSQALKFVRDGRKAIIRGRDFGKSLIKFVESMGATSVGQLIERVQDWAEHQSMLESAKRNASEQKLISIQDKRDCIEAFCEYDKLDGTEMTVADVTKKIQRIFAGKICPRCNKSFDDDANECWTCKVELVRPAGVLFSSVHKAKGLESSRVFLLEPKGASIPHPMAKNKWQLEQEWNVKYIAITRGINELVYVGD